MINLNDLPPAALYLTVVLLLILLVSCFVLFHRLVILKKTHEETLKLAEDKGVQLLRLVQECEKLRASQLDITSEIATSAERNAGLQKELTKAGAEKEKFESIIKSQQEEITALREKVTDYRGKIDNLMQLRDEDKERFEKSYQDLEQKLTILGNKMLKERSEALQEASSEHFKKAVQPLKEELDTFRNYLQSTQKNASEQAGALSVELKKLQEAQIKLSDQATDLSKALRSGGKSQGMWGELQLERVLDASGLTNGVEYLREAAGNRALGEMGRPDVVIRLPDNHALIIDAKCTLTDYTNYVNASNEGIKEMSLKGHLNSFKAHISGLAKRDYSEFKSLNSPSFVFMFVPIDGALTLVLQKEPSLYDDAARKGIYLVSPSTLIPALRVVSNLWMLSHQNERMRKLALDAQAVYNQFEKVAESFDDVRKKQESMDKALITLGDRLSNGRGNLKKRLENFRSKAPGVLMKEQGMTIESEPLEDQFEHDFAMLEDASAPNEDS
ncbi:MAG: DNA recombination protein RmuC [Succinivibrio sp.]|nr:DNA recombination protein RmuC [Succinivibrio sp.]